MSLLSGYFLIFIGSWQVNSILAFREETAFQSIPLFPSYTEDKCLLGDIYTKDTLIMKANLIALMLVERIIKVYMSTDKGRPVPFRSRSLLNQKVRKSQGWEESEDTFLVMRLVGKKSSGPEWN